MLRTALLCTLAFALTACGTTAQPTAEQLAPQLLPTAEIIPVPAAPSPVADAPAFRAAPEPQLAATAALLIDTPVLEATALPPTATVEQAAEPAAAPTAGPVERVITRIAIEAIALDRSPMAVGVDSEGVPFVPKHDVAWFRGSAVPGEGENIVLWGHALRFRDTPDIPAPFGQLSQLSPGDRIILYDASDTPHVYQIAEQIWATPNQVSYILPVGHERVTLVSCIGDRVVTERGVTMTHRLITIAEPVTL
jgi:LPXTG-site transpeptidase (sortase) family protein